MKRMLPRACTMPLMALVALVALVASTSVTACAAFSVLPVRSQMHELKVGREQREYILHVPRSYSSAQPTALVILLHGHGARAQTFEASTGMSGKADRKGFIVAYPQALGSPSVWHTGVDGSISVDDVAFIRALIGSISSGYNIDPDRIYVAGHSNGAFMAYRVGSSLSEQVAAIGISAGSIGRITPRGDTLRIAKPAHPVSVIAYHGLADNTVPYNGGKEEDGPRRIVAAPQSIQFWVQSDGCDVTPVSTVMNDGNVRRDDYTGCKDGTDVTFYIIRDGTHKWPGDKEPWWHFWGHSGSEPSATDEMWTFFQAHPKQRDSVAAGTH